MLLTVTATTMLHVNVTVYNAAAITYVAVTVCKCGIHMYLLLYVMLFF